MSNSINASCASNNISASKGRVTESETLSATRYQGILQLLNSTPKFTAEWFRLKEEEVQLRLNADIEESRCAGLFADSRMVEGGEVDDRKVGEANAERNLTLESSRQALNKSNDRPLTAQVPCDSRSKQQTATNSPYRPKDKPPNVIAGGLVESSSNVSSDKESDSSSVNQGEVRIGVTGLNNSRLSRVRISRDGDDVVKDAISNADIGIEEAKVVFCSTDDEPRPALFNWHSGASKGYETKITTGIETLHSINDQGPSPLVCLSMADSSTTGKLFCLDTGTRLKSDQCASSEVQSPPAAESNHSKLDQAFLSPDVVQQTMAVHPKANIGYGPHSSTQVIQRYDDTPSASSDVHSQLRQNDRRQEEEGKEDVILIPEALPVEANAPVEVADVGIAELVQPDQSTFQLKKRHACIALTMFAAIAIALGATIYFTRDTSHSIGSAKSTLISTPSLQPTFQPPSTQPSLIQPSMQPSLSIKYAIERNVLQRNATFDLLAYTDSRVLALDWIITKDKKHAASDENLFQRYILVLLAFEYSNLGWITDVKSDGTECDWLGVVCDKDEHVIMLNLDDNSLDGTVPPEIGSLQYLKLLSMSRNSLSKSLPYELGNLRNMSELYLNANYFTGSIPSEIFNLTMLTALDLSGNKLTGTLPLELQNLKIMTNLSLESNLFNGSLPSELGNLKELEALDFHGNQFSGTLPAALGNLKKLAVIDFSENKFSGTLPSELGNLSNLTQLKLTNNDFTGPLPTELGKLNMLNVLYLDFNKITGTLPSEFGNIIKLTEFDLYNNYVTGTLPSQIGNLIELTTLDVSQNRFIGTLPTEMGNLKKLDDFEVNENKLSGTVPTELGQLTMAWTFWLFSNNFSGTLPSELGKLTSVVNFWIYSNQLTGTLPSWIGDLTELKSLYVGGNRFVGTLPSELALLDLSHLGVDKNEFTGTLPSWIGDFRNLEVLWIQYNQFTGTFPSEIESNLDLHDFCAKGNNFTGPVPPDNEDWYTCWS